MNSENIPYTRPNDYFAEMIKTDEHMSKLKGVLLKEKKQIEEAQQRTKIRIQRKFAKKTQSDVAQKRQKEKKEELDAIKKWRKSRKGNTTNSEFPEDLLKKDSLMRKQLASSTTPDKAKPKSQKMTNTQKKALKYGQGGKKRGLKMNTTESVNDMTGWNTKRNRSTDFKKGPNQKKTVTTRQ